MTYVLTKPEVHEKFLSPNLAAYQVKGADYKFGVVTKVDTASKEVLVNDGSKVPYDALIVATGFDMPLICAGAGISLSDRKAEIQKAAAAIKAAQTVVVAGGGPTGLELAGDIRVAYPSKKIVLLCRDKILSQWPEQTRDLVTQGLKAQNIEVFSGVSEDAPTEPTLQAGSCIAGGEKIAYDVFIPSYSQGPNTKFLHGSTGLLDNKGRIVVNEFLQSTKCPEIFAVGVSTVDEPFIGMPKLEAQWKSATANTKALLSDKAMKKHSEGMPGMKLPPIIQVGRGKGGWANVDISQLPGPVKCCCCCGHGGFPCCPPPCCWPCCGPCCCGYCCGPSAGSGPAGFMGAIHGKFPGMHFKGWGETETAPLQQTM
mmetsp:Transcript_112128/g.229562  ORF Transcript_112128/g.229562 Transcript_112128/m.229562 type:complete len:370 (+) Transcript_112128:2-1111(+)